MANIYISDETKKKLDIVAEEDNRTNDGEIKHLCEQRLKELNIPADAKSSSDGDNLTQINNSSQEKNKNGQ